MTSKTDDGRTLEQLFLDWLDVTYAAERRIAEALPELIGRIGVGPLRQGMMIHLDRTKDQIVRLEEVFDIIDEEAAGGPAVAVDAILKEMKELLTGTGADETGEAAVTAAAKIIAAHEVARYGTLVAWSKELGREECTALLQRSLGEEVANDDVLSKAAEERMNRAA